MRSTVETAGIRLHCNKQLVNELRVTGVTVDEDKNSLRLNSARLQSGLRRRLHAVLRMETTLTPERPSPLYEEGKEFR